MYICPFPLESLSHLSPIPTPLGYYRISPTGASLVAQMVKNLPAMQETQVQSLGWEDPLEKGMATHSSILAWKISRTEEPGGLQSMRSQRVGYEWATNTDWLTVILGTLIAAGLVIESHTSQYAKLGNKTFLFFFIWGDSLWVICKLPNQIQD